jgi:hypothetical protein
MPDIHTNDIGVLIAEALDANESGTLEIHDWAAEEPHPVGTIEHSAVDASHGFSDLRVSAGGHQFRVIITRIG